MSETCTTETTTAEIEVDFDSLEVVWPEDDDGEVRDPEALNHYVLLDVVIDGRRVPVGCVVGAPESYHGTVRASGAGVRPFCTAWWADASDWECVPPGLRDEVLELLEEVSYNLYLRACAQA